MTVYASAAVEMENASLPFHWSNGEFTPGRTPFFEISNYYCYAAAYEDKCEIDNLAIYAYLI